ncbi:Hypothetical protein A7982_08689 [Minicystis rosea]|nr:Hypothetical protein A7982_08689 [Minicystis rosea]
MRLALLAAAALLVACGERGHAPKPSASTSASANAITATTAGATAPASGVAPAAVVTASSGIVGAPTNSAVALPPRVVDPEERVLEAAPLVSLAVAHRPLAARGTFDAVLGAPEGRRGVEIQLALGAEPTAHRHPLAFYRLAHALGARVVPVAALRHFGTGELAGAGADAEARGVLHEARILNDGTVDALVSAHAVPHAGAPWTKLTARPIDPEHGREPATWEIWASSPEPMPGEDPALLRDYVEMRVLDYLSANVARRNVLLAGHALVLADNGTAFPWRPEASVLDRMLRRLRTTARFPRGLRDALLAFDRERADAVFTDGGFETWLLTPRVRTELAERRAALLTLLEAKIAARGAEAVLCL